MSIHKASSALFIQNFIALIGSASFVMSAPMAVKAPTSLITYFFPPASICRSPTVESSVRSETMGLKVKKMKTNEEKRRRKEEVEAT